MLAAMDSATPSPSAPSRWLQAAGGRWQGLGPRGQLGLVLAAMTAAVGGWALVWLVPTEVVGRGVLLLPDNAGLLDARAAGQVRRIAVGVGESVKRGQVLLELYLPVLEKELEQQRENLRELERQNAVLDRRDRLRLQTEQATVDTAMAKLRGDADRYGALRATYAAKLKNLGWLAKREVVAPLSSEVVSVEQGLTSTAVNLDQVRIEEKKVLTAYEQVKLSIETEALQRRYTIDDLRRRIRVTEARLAYDGKLHADRDGQVLDLQVIPGQTVAVGQRLGTIGRLPSGVALRAVSYFAPADARRLRVGMPVEVVPQWNQRGRFGGIVGKVRQVNTLPATEEDISTTIGNPQLAKALVQSGPVMRTLIELERNPRSQDGFRWTLSDGSSVFPVREGLTIESHAYVEWRTPLSYVLPALRSITGGYRNGAINRTWKRGLEQGGPASW